MAISEKLTTLAANTQDILDMANDTTGAGDTSVYDAVGTLIAGYGRGGGKVILTGEFTTPSGSGTIGTVSLGVTINHLYGIIIYSTVALTVTSQVVSLFDDEINHIGTANIRGGTHYIENLATRLNAEVRETQDNAYSYIGLSSSGVLSYITKATGYGLAPSKSYAYFIIYD